MNAESDLSATLFELVHGRRPIGGESGELADLCADLDASGARVVQAMLARRRQCHASEDALLAALAEQPLSLALSRAGRLARADYERYYNAILSPERELIIGQRDYLPQHKERFWELFNACALLLDGRAAPTLLEFGTSEFSAMYKQFFGDLTLHLSDRPAAADYIGFTEAVGYRVANCDRYVAVDLERLPVAADDPFAGVRYDLIVFAEVLEHLVVNPVDLLRALLELLTPDGFLYLTTPNVFRAENRDKWLRMENPQQVYPAADGNWDGHHHHREYGAVELLRFVGGAGGEVVAFYYSDCWDASVELAPSERSNLVFLIAAGLIAPGATSD